MRCVALNLVVAIVALAMLVAINQTVHAQQIQGQLLGPGIGFRNDLKVSVIVQGVSIVNNMQRRGQIIVIQPGKTVWDNNLPLGLRFYTVYEATSQRILLKDQKAAIQMRADQFFAIKLGIGGVKMEQESVPMKEAPKNKK